MAEDDHKSGRGLGDADKRAFAGELAGRKISCWVQRWIIFAQRISVSLLNLQLNNWELTGTYNNSYNSPRNIFGKKNLSLSVNKKIYHKFCLEIVFIKNNSKYNQ